MRILCIFVCPPAPREGGGNSESKLRDAALVSPKISHHLKPVLFFVTDDIDRSPRRAHHNYWNETCTSSYLNYLHDARIAIRNCMLACKSWSDKYDGEVSSYQDKKMCVKNNECASKLLASRESDPSKEILPNSKPLENGVIHQNGLDEPAGKSGSDCDDNYDFWSVIASCKVDTLSDLENTLDKLNSFLEGNIKEFEFKSNEGISKLSALSSPHDFKDVMLCDCQKNRSTSSTAGKDGGHLRSRDCSFGSPDIGPFLGMLLTKLENMMNNSIYINLQLTGLFVRLAVYPQPLLKSFLLSHNLVFQPSVRSLSQVPVFLVFFVHLFFIQGQGSILRNLAGCP